MQTPTIDLEPAGPAVGLGVGGDTGPLPPTPPGPGAEAPQPQAQEVRQVEHQAHEQAHPGQAADPQPTQSQSQTWTPEEDSCIDAAVRKQLAISKDCEPSWKAQNIDLTPASHANPNAYANATLTLTLTLTLTPTLTLTEP